MKLLLNNNHIHTWTDALQNTCLDTKLVKASHIIPHAYSLLAGADRLVRQNSNRKLTLFISVKFLEDISNILEK